LTHRRILSSGVSVIGLDCRGPKAEAGVVAAFDPCTISK
jgi:hypothetical protein